MSRLGNLIKLGFEELEKEQFARVLPVDDLISMNQQKGNVGTGRLLVVDEDDGKAVFNYLQKNGITPHHTLTLSDIGIAEEDELGSESLQLLKDGIVAECVEVGDQIPGAHCPCCSS